MKELARLIEHTLLKAEATDEDIRGLCEEAVEFGFHSACVLPCHVRMAREALGGRARVTTVAGFPLGASVPEVKALEAGRAVSDGAQEVDMVMRVGAALDDRWDMVEDDIKSVREAIPGAVLKVIIEACFLSDEQKLAAVDAAARAGADFIKTSTGFGPSGATVEDVRLLKEAASGRVKVKAAGGIGSYAQAVSMVEAGADLIGTSSGVRIIEGSRG
jgi:deoxyribose-phosphate aldolase